MTDNGAVELVDDARLLGNKVLVSTKKPMQTYVSQTKKLLPDHDEVSVSALGTAMSTVVAVAAALEEQGLVERTSVRTSMEALSDAGRTQPVYKAKMEIVLRKTDRFGEIMAQQEAEAAAEAEADVGHEEEDAEEEGDDS